MTKSAIAAVALPLCLFVTQTRAGEAVKVTVGLVESRGAPLKSAELVGLTDYLASLVGEGGKIKVIPRAEVRKRAASLTTGVKDMGLRDAMGQTLEAGHALGADFLLLPTISKVGRRCLVTIWAVPADDPGAAFGLTDRQPCQADRLINAMERAGPRIRALLDKAGKRSGAKRLAVHVLASRGSPLSADEVFGLTEYLAIRMTEDGWAVALPGHALKGSQDKAMRDRAQLSLSGSISKVGEVCLTTCQLFDLQAKATLVTSSVKKACRQDDLIRAVDQCGRKLVTHLRPAEAP